MREIVPAFLYATAYLLFWIDQAKVRIQKEKLGIQHARGLHEYPLMDIRGLVGCPDCDKRQWY